MASRSLVRPTRGGVEDEKVVEHRRRERRVVKMDGVGTEGLGEEGADWNVSSDATGRGREGAGG